MPSGICSFTVQGGRAERWVLFAARPTPTPAAFATSAETKFMLVVRVPPTRISFLKLSKFSSVFSPGVCWCLRIGAYGPGFWSLFALKQNNSFGFCRSKWCLGAANCYIRSWNDDGISNHFLRAFSAGIYYSFSPLTALYSDVVTHKEIEAQICWVSWPGCQGLIVSGELGFELRTAWLQVRVFPRNMACNSSYF